MRHLYLLLLTLAGATVLAFSACVKAPQVTISTPENIELSADGSSGTITFTANRDWTIRCSDSWIHVTPSSGEASKNPVTVTVSCDANTTYDQRSATVTIKAEEAVQTLTVNQPQNLGVVVPTQNYIVLADSNTLEIEVMANIDYNVSINANWIRQIGTKALTRKVFIFDIDENTSYDDREAKITIKPQNSSISEQVISVLQAAKPALKVEKLEYEVGSTGGALEIAVITNVEFEVKSESDWIRYSQTKALSNKTIVFYIEKNSGSEERNGKVLIAQKNGSLTCTVNIAQLVKPKEAVDLGLSVLWAESNLNENGLCQNPEDLGDYYAWGETESKYYTSHSWDNYKWGNGDYKIVTKYCPPNRPNYWAGNGNPDGKTILDAEDDVANIKLGGKWHIPTDEEWGELLNNCTWTWTSMNGRTGYHIKSKTNNNSIFLPATGYSSDGISILWGNLGFYWSSSLDTDSPYCARCVEFEATKYHRTSTHRSDGFTIRPVSE